MVITVTLQTFMETRESFIKTYDLKEIQLELLLDHPIFSKILHKNHDFMWLLQECCKHSWKHIKDL